MSHNTTHNISYHTHHLVLTKIPIIPFYPFATDFSSPYLDSLSSVAATLSQSFSVSAALPPILKEKKLV